MGKKYTIEEVKNLFEKEGYQLLTTEYINSKQKLDYICSKGHKYYITLDSWQQGNRCKICGIESRANKKRLSLSFIKSEFAKEDYQLLTVEYKNNRQKLYYICPNNHQHSTNWDNWKQGNRCPYCSGKAKPTIDFIKSEFEKEGYRLLTTEYKNSEQRLDYTCPSDHRHSIRWHDWQGMHRCPVCAVNKRKHSLDFIKHEFERTDYQLLTTEYKNSRQKLDYICHNGHQHSITWNDWQQGNRCPTCANINSVTKFLGFGNPNWKGGISCEPYCDIWSDKEYKADIKERDGNQCLNPYCFHGTKKLHIHHIDYDKKNCAPQNLITVCNSCNSHANYNRKWHTEWYRKILNKRYGYKY
jgi:hypothetical protein